MTDERTPEQLAFDRKVLELHRQQEAGELPPPGRITRRQIGKALGFTQREVREIEDVAIAVIRRAFAKQLRDQQPS